MIIPFEDISSISITASGSSNDCLKIVLVDSETYIEDEYIFAYFNCVKKVYDLILMLIHKSSTSSMETLADTKISRTSSFSTRLSRQTADNGLDTPLYDTPKELAWFNQKLLNTDVVDESSDTLKSKTLIQRSDDSLRSTIRKRPETQLRHQLSISKAPQRKVHSWWSGHRKSVSDGSVALSVSDSESEARTIKDKESESFQNMFGFPSTETLINSFGAYLIKVFPYLGTVYVSSNHVSFRSKLAGSRAKCIVPIDNILKLEKAKGYFYFGLTITTLDHEEILFEFHTQDSQLKCYELIHDHSSFQKFSQPTLIPARNDSLDDITHYDYHIKTSFELESEYLAYPPPVKSPKKMTIVFITIGTRGDVQPFIALCLGFMKDNHKCILATHLEFKEWIESFGIEFKEIKGNPAELMKLCVDYGMFSVGFIYNAMANVFFCLFLVPWMD